MGGTLKTLNLKNANIVEGGNSYYLTDYFTQNDVIGDYMFYAMTALEKIGIAKCGGEGCTYQVCAINEYIAS